VADFELAEFQEAAVKLISERLRDRKGSRRFLLADEVGLGKTVVARGVLEDLLRHKKSLTVVYLCSNVEIAEQNRKKLDPDAERPLRRVSELATTRPPDRRLRLFSFTPGTSLQDGTGVVWERRLLLFLVWRLLRIDFRRGRWKAYFKCGAGEGTWAAATSLRALRRDFNRVLTREFQRLVLAEWRRPVVVDGKELVGADLLVAEAPVFEEEDLACRRRRNLIVGLLRQGLQRVALDHLSPDLVILDEVQRFRNVLADADDATSIASRLFRKGAAVLVLSATPYRMLALDHEGDGHYQEFLDTVKFLYGRRGATETALLRADLEAFRRRLERPELLAQGDAELLALRGKLEGRLRRVVSRTERNWYIESHGKGVEEVRPKGESFAAPRREELADYVRLRRFLLDKVATTQHVTEYWKSCPAPFTFMDAQYAPMAATRRRRQALPPGLVAHPRDLGKLSDRSLRFRELFRAIFGEGSTRWRYLWTRPTYTYYRDDFFGDADPRKMLVFSGWRFVPKAIALLTSHEAEQRIRPKGSLWSAEEKAPLRFGEQRAFHVFDVCYPSLALAGLVNPATAGAENLTAKDVLQRTRRALSQALAAAGVKVGETSKGSAWEVVARLEACFAPDRVKAGLKASAAYSGDGMSERFREHADEFISWMGDGSSALCVSQERLEHLAQIAAFSPANALLRAFWDCYPETRGGLPEGLVDLTFIGLRSYFNRRVVRAVVEGAVSAPGYARAVVRYCEQAHFQAVVDEYLFLVRTVLQRADPKEGAAQLGRVLGIGTGTPTINVTAGLPSAGGHLKPEPLARHSHFALAFGDDLRSEQETGQEQSAESRKTAVREAFNSPFWPFVLSTTSVGQEGLDFHLFCRDIVHWNLPSNPVDLEQREGRINRRDGLSLRRSIALDWPLARVAKHTKEAGATTWRRVFDAIAADPGPQQYKHGLYPHWVYDCACGKNVPIRRHLFFYENSSDARAYAELKDRLALYRLVFGQPRQQDLLDRLRRSLSSASDAQVLERGLTRYMINLSPITHQQTQKRSWREARALLGDEAGQAQLLADVVRIERDRGAELAEVSGELSFLKALVAASPSSRPRKETHLERALYALCYLRNPYDTVFDMHTGIGLAEDCQIIAQAARRIRQKGGARAQSGEMALHQSGHINLE
jgi:hypothetical protein